MFTSFVYRVAPLWVWGRQGLRKAKEKNHLSYSRVQLFLNSHYRKETWGKMQYFIDTSLWRITTDVASSGLTSFTLKEGRKNARVIGFEDLFAFRKPPFSWHPCQCGIMRHPAIFLNDVSTWVVDRQMCPLFIFILWNLFLI